MNPDHSSAHFANVRNKRIPMAITIKPELYGYGIKRDDNPMGTIKSADLLSGTASVPTDPRREIAIPVRIDDEAIRVEGVAPYIPVA